MPALRKPGFLYLESIQTRSYRGSTGAISANIPLGLGEGGEQNAPLGRAVIGGLLFATVTTLFVVPIIYSYLRTKPPVDHERRLEEEKRNDSIDSEWNSTKPYLSI